MTEQRSPIAAGLLALLFPGLGMLYLGKPVESLLLSCSWVAGVALREPLAVAVVYLVAVGWSMAEAQQTQARRRR